TAYCLLPTAYCLLPTAYWQVAATLHLNPDVHVRLLVRLLGYTRRHWLIVAGIIAAMTSESALRLVPAWLTKTVVDDVVIHGTFGQLFWLVLLLFVVTGVAKALNSAQNYFTEWLGQNVTHDLRNDLYRHLQGQSMSFYDSNQTGQLMSRVTSDV